LTTMQIAQQIKNANAICIVSQTSAVIVDTMTTFATDVTAPVVFTVTSFNYLLLCRDISSTAAHGRASTVSVAADVTPPALRSKAAVVEVGCAIVRRFGRVYQILVVESDSSESIESNGCQTQLSANIGTFGNHLHSRAVQPLLTTIDWLID